jgi:hypothetical protein
LSFVDSYRSNVAGDVTRETNAAVRVLAGLRRLANVLTYADHRLTIAFRGGALALRRRAPLISGAP